MNYTVKVKIYTYKLNQLDKKIAQLNFINKEDNFTYSYGNNNWNVPFEISDCSINLNKLKKLNISENVKNEIISYVNKYKIEQLKKNDNIFREIIVENPDKSINIGKISNI